VHLNQVAKPGDILVCADASTTSTASQQTAGHPSVIGYNGLSYGNHVAYRHPGTSANVFFVDGHAKPQHIEQLGGDWSATFYQKYPWMEKWH
jgi:prepilin-type processing-associated H-X9-DG protein